MSGADVRMPRTAEHNAKIGAAIRARTTSTKVCPRCGVEKPREEFGESCGRTKSYCPPCLLEYGRERSRRYREAHPEFRERERQTNRATTLRRYYGMTPEEYAALLDAQAGVCAICGGEQSSGRRVFLDVDHDHETGAVRGLLCSHCNRAIGFMLDDPARLRAAADYLERGAS